MHAPLFGPWVHAPFLGPWVSAWVGNRRRSCLWGLDDGLTLHTCLQFQTQVPLALVSPGLGQQVGQLPREGKGGGSLTRFKCQEHPDLAVETRTSRLPGRAFLWRCVTCRNGYIGLADPR